MYKELLVTLHEISHQGNIVSTKILQYLYSISVSVSRAEPQRVCGLRCHAAAKTGSGGSCDTLQLLRCSHDPQVQMDHSA